MFDFVFVCSSVCVWLGQMVTFGGNTSLSQTALIVPNFYPLQDVLILIGLNLSYVCTPMCQREDQISKKSFPSSLVIRGHNFANPMFFYRIDMISKQSFVNKRENES